VSGIPFNQIQKKQKTNTKQNKKNPTNKSKSIKQQKKALLAKHGSKET